MTLYPVKPSCKTFTEKPTFFVVDQDILTPSGELLDRSQLARIFGEQTEICRWVVHDSGFFAYELIQQFGDTPGWNFTGNEMRQRMGFDSKGRERYKLTTRITRIGWSGSGNGASRYHEVYDLEGLFNLKSLTVDLPSMVELYRDLEDFCRTNDFPMFTSRGNLAQYLLRHPAFYSRPRRKVPMATNENIRKYGLDGNYYHLPEGCNTGVRHNVVVQYDITKAHPTVVADELVKLPDSNNFYARGYFHEALAGQFKPWLVPGTPKYETVTSSYMGSYLIRLDPIDIPEGWTIGKYYDLMPEWLMFPYTTGRRIPCGHDDEICDSAVTLLVHSNELYWLERFNVKVHYICGAWLSPVQDSGIVKLSQWIVSELEGASETRKQWLKPSLLATYGSLATTPTLRAFCHARSKGEAVQIKLSPRVHPVTAYVTRSDRVSEPKTNHVAQRALIESQTVNEVLEAAILLRRCGYAPIHIYADSIYCLPPRNFDGNPPELPGFKSKVHTQFVSVHLHAVSSDQETKLPGVPRSARRAAEIRATQAPVSGWLLTLPADLL